MMQPADDADSIAATALLLKLENINFTLQKVEYAYDLQDLVRVDVYPKSASTTCLLVKLLMAGGQSAKIENTYGVRISGGYVID